MNKITLYYGTSRLYSNRIVQADLSNDKTLSLENVNFIQADGINTVFTFNITSENMEEYSNIAPSYAIVDDSQCWYVISCNKQRQGQITLTLRRDFLSEKWDILKSAPFLCTKAATIPTSIEEAKYQKTTNLSQIKKAEYLIKDNENADGYIVGYVAKAPANADNTNYFFNQSQSEDEEGVKVNDGYKISSNNQNSYAIEVAGINNWEYYNKLLVYITSTTKLNISIQSKENPVYIDYQASVNNYYILTNKPNAIFKIYDTEEEASNWYEDFKSALNKTFIYALNTYYDSRSFEQINNETILDYNGKLIHDTSTGYVYKVNIIKAQYTISLNDTKTSLSKELYEKFKEYFGGAGNQNKFPGDINYTTYEVILIQQDEITDSTQIGNENNDYTKCLDTPYDIFVMPLKGSFIVNYGDKGTYSISIKKNKVLDIVKKIQSTLTNSILYDVQLLPYIPFNIPDNIVINPTGEKEQFYPIITYTGSGADIEIKSIDGIMIWLETSQGQISINTPLKINILKPNMAISNIPAYNSTPSISIDNNALGQRIFNEENLFRIVSPNYSSQFEFNPVKNEGLAGFIADIALKPYQPYIYISPIFNNLYGTNFRDGRGLILSGDYSLDQVNDQWQTYKLNNKNYELIFNRQIQSMELSNTYQNRLAGQSVLQNTFNAISGTAQGALSGFIAGGAAGAVVGGLASGAAGIADIAVNASNLQYEQALRDDNVKREKDIYQYKLGNIQALPATLTKVSAINPDFKVYPLIEYYSCTENEDTHLREAIKYNGIDINLTCTLQDFTKGYISGSILQFPTDLNISEEQARAINFELQSGVYYKEA